jgi:hypothetical protein
MGFADEIKKHTKPPIKGKKIDIEEAEVVTEQTDNVDDSTSNSGIDDSYINNLKDQKTIDLGDVGKKQSGEKVTIDFMDESHIHQFTSSQAKKAPENNTNGNSNFNNKSAEEIQAEIKKAEEDSKKNFTAKDFEDIASFIIFLIDTGIASALKWWSKDTSESAYSLPEKKKQMLSYQLSLILMKYQAKFSIEFMFILTLFVVYIPPFMLAKNRKKEIANAKVQPVVVNNIKKEEKPDIVKDANVKVEEEVVKTSPVNVGASAKRKKGGQQKA